LQRIQTHKSRNFKHLQLWNLKAIGPEWNPVKAAAPQVVIEHIEHIEQPSEN